MIVFAYLPEIVAFLLFILVSIQDFTLGPILVATQIALMGVLLVVRPSVVLTSAARWWPVLLTPIMAMLSASWSSVPDLSLRYGLQFLFTAFVGVHLARQMSPRRFITLLFYALFVFLILCVISGKHGSSADGPVLIGLTGSKNQISYDAQLLSMAALTVLFMSGTSLLTRWAAVLSLPLAVFLLVGTHSATGVLMAIGGAFVLLLLWMSQRLTPGARLAAVIGGVVVLAPLTMLAPEAQEAINHFVFNTLNKDPTLTGRTLLWQHADALIAQRPVLGYGFQAIWMGDSSETIGLQRLTGITEGRAFHFHNTFRQIAVDTGLLGLAIFVTILTVVGFKGLAQALLRPRPETAFFFTLFLLMVARAFSDLIIGPFSIHTILLYACCVYAFWRPEYAAAQDQPFGWLRRVAPASAVAPMRYP